MKYYWWATTTVRIEVSYERYERLKKIGERVETSSN